jgi:DNA-binding NarL/FixJ family response regulator
VTGRVRVLIADDQPLFTHALEAILADDEQIEVVGSAQNGNTAVELAAELQPDVVVMDISMPLVDGLEATRRIRRTGSPARVIVLTESDLPSDAGRARRAGADGYLPKSRAVSDLRAAMLALCA